MTRVRSVMRAHPWTIDVGAPVRRALELMEVGGMRHLPVTDSGHLVGIVSDRDLRALRLELRDARNGVASLETEDALAQPIGSVMERGVISVSPHTSIEDAVQLLREHTIGALPVLDEARIVGILSVIDVLAYFGGVLADDWPARCVGDVMTERVFTLLPTDPIDAALALMQDHGVLHAPVLDDEGAVVGVLSHRDLLGLTAPRAQTVAEVMHVAETVERDTLLADAADLLVENAFGCVPVVENRRLVGILTESDFARRAAVG